MTSQTAKHSEHPDLAQRYAAIRQRLHELGGDAVHLLAVSKKKSAAEIAQLAALGQRAFGENYLQEALPKIEALAGRELEWHFIGRLQSNKCAEVASHFDWCQSVDRIRLINGLASRRDPARDPLQVLLQVNVDAEPGKGGADPSELPALAAAVAAAPTLCLRGLMAIPTPSPVLAEREAAFARLAALFEELRKEHPQMDTLSMGMSDDYPSAIAQGSTMIRIGTALFGPRA